MKKLSIISLMFLHTKFLLSQDAFLEIRPFDPPSFEQYSASQHVDHHYPYSNEADNVFLRFDGVEFTDDVIYPDCLSGSSCYDGHAGVDYYMPFETIILAPASGYVLWASFSPPADPCPGNITPNGDQGTIIIAHGNGYYTVYLHMTPPLKVEVGETVETGDTLGFAGNTGCAINTHLHFEIRKNNWFFDTEEPYAVDPFGWWNDTNDPIEELRGNRSNWLWVTDSLVDDGDNGFQRFKGPDWQYLNYGFNNDCWTSPTTNNQNESRHYAIWVPKVYSSGEYNIEVFIPEGSGGSTQSIYELYIKNNQGISNKTEVVVNQTLNTGGFQTIETMFLEEGTNFSIILRDIVTNESEGNNVVFDAIRVSPLTTIDIMHEKKNSSSESIIEINSVFPNPFNSSINMNYKITNETFITISVYDLNGNIIAKFPKIKRQKGNYIFTWNGKNNLDAPVSSGIYFFDVVSNTSIHKRKILYIK